MRKHLGWGTILGVMLAFPQLANATGSGYTQTVGLHTLLTAKLGSTTKSTSSSSTSGSNYSSGSQATYSGPQTLPTQTLPTQTQTIVQQYIQPVVQPIQQIIQPVVQTVIQPVITQSVAQPIYSVPTYLNAVYQGSSAVNVGALTGGNPYLQSHSIANFGGYSGGGYSGGGYSGGGYSGGGYSKSMGQKSGKMKVSSHHGMSAKQFQYSQPQYYAPQPQYYAPQPQYYAPQQQYYAPQQQYYASSYGGSGFNSSYYRGFASGPVYSNYSTGYQNSFAFGGAAFGSGAGSVSVNVGNNVVVLPGFDSLGTPKIGETLQKIYNYSAGFDVGGVRYTVDVSSRLTASFASPSASPSSVKSI